MKKVVIYLDILERGGAERVTVYLSNYFVQHGVSCDIITSRIGKNEYEIPDGVNRFCLNSKFKIKQIYEMRYILKDIKPDVLLVMGVSNAMLAIPASCGLKIKRVVSERNDPLHPTGKMIVNKISRFLMKSADGFVFQTEDAKRFYDKKLKNKGVVIYNPLISANMPEPYVGKRKKVIVSAGRLAPQKNQKLLIETFTRMSNEFNDYKLIIYGEGPLRYELESLISSLKMKNRIFLPGNIVNLHNEINDAALFVMTSDFEGMPNALIEAMALGLPCISTDCPCGGPREIIKNDYNGLLVNVNDSNALESAIRKMLTEPIKAQEMGYMAVYIRNLLHIDEIGKQWMEYLSQ